MRPFQKLLVNWNIFLIETHMLDEVASLNQLRETIKYKNSFNLNFVFNKNVILVILLESMMAVALIMGQKIAWKNWQMKMQT